MPKINRDPESMKAFGNQISDLLEQLYETEGNAEYELTLSLAANKHIFYGVIDASEVEMVVESCEYPEFKKEVDKLDEKVRVRDFLEAAYFDDLTDEQISIIAQALKK